MHPVSVMRLFVRVGEACEGILDTMLRGLRYQRIDVDRVRRYACKKQLRVILATDSGPAARPGALSQAASRD